MNLLSIQNSICQTLVQQILSLIAQYGGIRTLTAWEILCNSGPFNAVDKSTFARLLRSLASFDILMQDSEGLLLLGKKVRDCKSLFVLYGIHHSRGIPACKHKKERQLAHSRLDYPLVPGVFLIFAGKRWEVVDVEIDHKIVVFKTK